MICQNVYFKEKEHNYPRPRGYKIFFMLNSAEHEILNAHKYKNIKKFSFFSMLR